MSAHSEASRRLYFELGVLCQHGDLDSQSAGVHVQPYPFNPREVLLIVRCSHGLLSQREWAHRGALSLAQRLYALCRLHAEHFGCEDCLEDARRRLSWFITEAERQREEAA